MPMVNNPLRHCCWQHHHLQQHQHPLHHQTFPIPIVAMDASLTEDGVCCVSEMVDEDDAVVVRISLLTGVACCRE